MKEEGFVLGFEGTNEVDGGGDKVGRREGVLQVSQVAALHILAIGSGVMRGTIKISEIFG